MFSVQRVGVKELKRQIMVWIPKVKVIMATRVKLKAQITKMKEMRRNCLPVTSMSTLKGKVKMKMKARSILMLI